MASACFYCRQKAADCAYQHMPACKRCFSALVLGRVKAALRENDVKKGEKVFSPGPLCSHFLKEILLLPFELVEKRPGVVHERKAERIVSDDTADDTNLAFLEQLFSKKKRRQPKNKNAVYLFSLLTDEDLMQYAQLKKLNFGPKKKEGPVFSFYSALKKKYPEIVHTLGRNRKEIEELSNNKKPTKHF